MMGIYVLVVNVLCELLLIIEKARRSYMQSIECNKTIRIPIDKWDLSEIEITVNFSAK
jgi:hypothetical protein